jgi:hypothetical protein
MRSRWRGDSLAEIAPAFAQRALRRAEPAASAASVQDAARALGGMRPSRAQPARSACCSA